jgi:hypothetical protein
MLLGITPSILLVQRSALDEPPVAYRLDRQALNLSIDA